MCGELNKKIKKILIQLKIMRENKLYVMWVFVVESTEYLFI